jgi:hypothetical protein
MSTILTSTEGLTPCICERCQAEHYGGNYFLCPDCEHGQSRLHYAHADGSISHNIIFTITEDS